MRWSRTLLRRDCPGGRAKTLHGLHTDRAREGRSDEVEFPTTVGGVDPGTGDGSSPAGTGEEVDARAEGTGGRHPGVDTFHAQLARLLNLLGQVDGHGVRRQLGGGRYDGLGHRPGARRKVEVTAVDG